MVLLEAFAFIFMSYSQVVSGDQGNPVIKNKFRGGGTNRSSSSNLKRNEGVQTTLRTRKRQWGWHNNNERKRSYHTGKGLYSSMLQKGIDHQNYDSGGENDHSSSSMSSSYLFMSENEEEEKIIRALSIPPPMDEENSELYEHEDRYYDVYYDDQHYGNEEVKTFTESNNVDGTTMRSSVLTKKKFEQNHTILDVNNSTVTNHQSHPNITKSKTADNAHDHNDNEQLEGARKEVNPSSMKETKEQIRPPTPYPVRKYGLNNDSTSTFDNNNRPEDRFIKHDNKIDENPRSKKSIPIPSRNQNEAPDQSIGKVKRQNNNKFQRRNFIPSFPKRINPNNDNMKIPIEIPSSIDDIRSRAEASKKSSFYSTMNKSSPDSSYLQQKHNELQQQQVHTTPTNDYIKSNNILQGLQNKEILPTANIASPKISPVTSSSPKKISPTTMKTKAATTMSLTTPWARKFILSRPKDSLLPIPREFLIDGFNLVQLAPIVESLVKDSETNHELYQGNTASSTSSPYPSLYKAALRLILEETDPSTTSSHFNSTKVKPSSSTTSPLQKKSIHSPSQVQKAAEIIYTLVHARYVSSPRGLDTIRRMFLRNYEIGTNQVFGKCPRVTCSGTPLLPFGYSNSFDVGCEGGIERKSLRYCCCCGEAFYMWESKVDGSAWGPSFCHLFLMTYGKELFSCLNKNNDDSERSKLRKEQSQEFLQQQYQQHRPIPRIFGFRIHQSANVQYPSL